MIQSRGIRHFIEILHDLQKDGKGQILIIIATGWFFSLGVRLMFPPLLPYLKSEFGFSLSVSGLLLAVLWASYAIGQFPGGIFGDRIGEGNILVISTFISAIMILIVSISPNLWTLFVATAGFGLATALYGPTRFTIFTDIYRDRSGTAIGLTMAAGSMGNAVLPVMAGISVLYLSWRSSFALIAPFFLLSSLAMWFILPTRTSPKSKVSSQLSTEIIHIVRSTIHSFNDKKISTIMVIQIFMVLVFQGFMGFYPTFLIEIKGFSPQVASILFGLFFATGIIVQPLAGNGKDVLGAKVILILLLFIATTGFLLLSMVHDLYLIFVATLLLGTLNGYGTVTQSFLAEELPSNIKGSALGLLRTGFILLGTLSPLLIGLAGDLGYLQPGFLSLMIIIVVALSITVYFLD